MTIPKRMHQIWIGGQPPPPVAKWMASWSAMHADWDYCLWTDDNRPRLRNEEAFAQAPSLAMKADLLRYEVLLDHGGVYVDADFECHRPIDLLVQGKSLLFVSEFGVVCNGVLGSEPQSEFMSSVVATVAQRVAGASPAARQQPHLLTGPHLIDELFVSHSLPEQNPGCLLPGDYFFEPRSRVPEALGLAKRKRYATHHALATWRHENFLEVLRKRSKLRTRLGRFVDLTAP